MKRFDWLKLLAWGGTVCIGVLVWGSALCSCSVFTLSRPDVEPPHPSPMKPAQPKPPAPPVIHAQATGNPSDTDLINDLMDERAELQAKIAANESKLKSANEEKDRLAKAATLAPILALCRWAAYVGIAAALAGVAWAVLIGVVGRFVPAFAVLIRFIPLGWQAGLAIAAAGGALAIVALTIGAVLPAVMKVAIVAFGIAVFGGLLWLIARNHEALRSLWHKTQDEAASDPRLAKVLKHAGVDLP